LWRFWQDLAAFLAVFLAVLVAMSVCVSKWQKKLKNDNFMKFATWRGI